MSKMWVSSLVFAMFLLLPFHARAQGGGDRSQVTNDAEIGGPTAVAGPVDQSSNPFDAPSSAHLIPVKYGHVDAITGNLSLNIPLGPRLPGRIPLGFSLLYDSSRIDHSETFHPPADGRYSPIIWPTIETASLTIHAKVGSTDHAFIRNYQPGTSIPSIETVKAWLRLRGMPSTTQFDFGAVYPSLSGTSFLIVGQNAMAIVSGVEGIWTLGVRSQNRKSYLGNLGGDLVSVEEVFDYGRDGFVLFGAALNITIKNERYPSHFITGSVIFHDLQRGVSTLSITNPFGLPRVEVLGRIQADLRQKSVLLGDVVQREWDDMADVCIVPSRITRTANNGEVHETTFNWPEDLLDPASSILTGLYLVSITHPEGLVESFDWGHSRIMSGNSFVPVLGSWGGYHLMKLLYQVADAFGSINGQQFPHYIGMPAVTGITRSGNGPGQRVLIGATLPLVDFVNGTWVWTQPERSTLVVTYPTSVPSGSSAYRGWRFTHPSGGSWTDPVMDSQGYLFATQAILKAERIHGSGLLTNDGQEHWSLTDINVDAATVYSGWDLKNYCNPAGVMSLPMNATATRVTTYTPSLPIRSRVLGGWDGYGYSRLQEETTYPSPIPTVNPMVSSAWVMPTLFSNAFLYEPPVALRKTIATTPFWDNQNGLLLTSTQSQSLTGTDLPALRGGVSSADLGTINYAGYNLGRPGTVTTTRRGGTTSESCSYLLKTALPTDATKSISLEGQPLPGSGNLGKSFGYGPAPFYWLEREKDLPDGRWTTYLRDDLGRTIQQTSVLGLVTRFTYDPWGRVQTVIRYPGTSREVVTTHTYDVNGLWQKVSVSGGGTATSVWTGLDSFGRVTLVQNYDHLDRMLAVQSFDYDGFGQKVAQSPLLHANPATGAIQKSWGSESWTFDGEGRLVAHSDALGRVLTRVTQQPTWTQDAISGMTGVIATSLDDRGFSRTSVFDLLGQKVAVDDQKGQVSSYLYDQDGNLRQTVQGAQIRSYTYNDLGWLTSRTEPEEGTTTFSNFTVLGTPLSSLQKGRRGASVVSSTTAVNAWLLPSSITTSDGRSTLSRTITYSNSSHLPLTISESQPNGMLTESYGYDDLFRLSYKSTSDGSQVFEVNQGFDGLGRVSSLTYPKNGGRSESLAYAYDDLNRLVSIKKAGEAILRGSMDYDQIAGTSLGQTLTLGNGAYTIQRMDLGELVQVIHGRAGVVWESLAVAWTAGGLMTLRGSDTFAYDELRRLQSARVANPQTGTFVKQTFGYDRYGNRTATTTQGASGTLALGSEALSWTATNGGSNDLPQVVSTVGGNLATGVAYDELGRMTQVWTTPGQPSTLTTWGYDAAGRVTSENGTRYLLDSEGLRFKRMKADGRVQYTVYGFSREPLTVFDRATPSSALSWQRTMMYGFGQLVCEDQASGSLYLQGDQVGSPNRLSNAQGVVVNMSKNLPFGERLLNANPNAPRSLRRYTNHEEDPDSNAIYMQARTYLPAYGKFAQVDPAYDQTKDDPESWNLYNYVTNNPVTHTDPDGRQADTTASSPDSQQATPDQSSGHCSAQTGADDQRQKLIKAQDAARTDPSLQPKVGADGKSIEATFCNIGLVKQAADVGASLAPLVDSKGTPLLANQQAKNLAQSSDYKEVSAKEAQRLADNGVIAIAAAGNASGHGHVATVRPQNVAGDSPTGRNGPIINNIGAHNEIRRESAAFPPSMTPKYYVPASSQ